MRKNRFREQNRCHHLISRLAHRAFFLDDEEKVRTVSLRTKTLMGALALVAALFTSFFTAAVDIASNRSNDNSNNNNNETNKTKK